MEEKGLTVFEEEERAVEQRLRLAKVAEEKSIEYEESNERCVFQFEGLRVE